MVAAVAAGCESHSRSCRAPFALLFARKRIYIDLITSTSFKLKKQAAGGLRLGRSLSPAANASRWLKWLKICDARSTSCNVDFGLVVAREGIHDIVLTYKQFNPAKNGREGVVMYDFFWLGSASAGRWLRWLGVADGLRGELNVVQGKFRPRCCARR